MYKFDHLFPANVDVPMVILYGELGTVEFAAAHSVLLKLALGNQIQYIFRHFYKVFE